MVRVSDTDGNGVIGFRRKSPLAVRLAGGSQAQRISIKQVLQRIEDVETTVIDTDEAQRPTEGSVEADLFVLLLDPSNQEKWPSVLVAPALHEHAQLVVALLADNSPRFIRAALKAGADDVFSMPLSTEDAVRMLLRAAELRRRREELCEKAICSLVSLSGGRGVNHLTVSLGFAVRRLFEKRTALIDLDLQASPLAVLLELQPEHTIGELVDPTNPIDSIRIESVLSKHESGLCLLAAPKLVEEAELISSRTVAGALEVLHELFDVLIVDCGNHISESSVVAFESSHHLLYVLDQSITAVRACQRFLRLFSRLGLRGLEPKLIVNRYQEHYPLTLRHIETALQLPVFATVPRDDPAYIQMETKGLAQWSASSASGVRNSLEDLTCKLFNTQNTIAKRPGLLGRFLATLGH